MKTRILSTALLVLALAAAFGFSAHTAPVAHAANCVSGLNYVLEATYQSGDGHGSTNQLKLYALRDVNDIYCGRIYAHMTVQEASSVCNAAYQDSMADSTTGTWLFQFGQNFSGCGAGSAWSSATFAVAAGHAVYTQIEVNAISATQNWWTAN